MKNLVDDEATQRSCTTHRPGVTFSHIPVPTTPFPPQSLAYIGPSGLAAFERRTSSRSPPFLTER